MKSLTSQEAKFTELTQNVFFVHYENSFVVLPDAKTIVGINKIDESTLIMENIKTKKAINFGIREGYLCTLLYDKVTGSLLTGDDWGIIFHYKRGGNQGNFCLVKKYENLGIKSVKSTAQMGGLAILGDFGEWDSSLILIDIHKREVCQKKKKILYFPNFSLHVFRGQNQEMYLSLGANFFFYDYITIWDLLDETQIYKIGKMETEQSAPEVNRMLTIPHSKDALVQPSMFETPQLDSDWPLENTSSKGIPNQKKTQKPFLLCPPKKVDF